MDSRRRGPGGPSDPPSDPERSELDAGTPRPLQREGTGSLRLWGDDPLRNFTPPHGSVDPGYRPGVAEQVPIPADPTDPALPVPEAIDVPIQVAEPATDPEAAAIWDRAFVAEPKLPALVLGPDAKPVGRIEGRDLPTIAIRTVQEPEVPRRRLGPLLVLVGLALGAGVAIGVWRQVRASRTAEALARAMERSQSDTVAGNLESIEALEALRREVPDRADVIDALAERAALYALRFDPSGPNAQRTALLARSPGATPGLLAARATDALLRGDRRRAEEIATRSLSSGARSAALALVRARIRLDAAAPDAAIQDLLWAEGVEPEWPAPLALRIDAERRAGRLVDARESLTDLRRHAPEATELPVVATLVEVDAALLAPTVEGLQAAHQRIEQVLARLDSRARIPAARLRLAGARVDLARGSAAAALESLRALRSVLGNTPELIHALAQAQMSLGDPNAALATLADSPPVDLEATWLRTEVLLQLERPEAALSELGRLGDAATPDRRHLVEGLAAWMALDSARAAQELEALDFASVPAELRDDAALAWIGALSETVEWARVNAAVQRLGGLPVRSCARAILNTMWANERGALESLTSASRSTAEGESEPACVGRQTGRLALASGDAEGAVLHLRAPLLVGRPSGALDLAEAVWRHQGREPALEVARHAVELGPTAPRVLLPLAALLGRLGARPELSRAIEHAVDPDLHTALLARGLRNGGDRAGASAALSTAGDSPIVQLERAETALEDGDSASALAASEAALAVPPALYVEAITTRVRALVAAHEDRTVDRLLDRELQRAQRDRGDRFTVRALRLLHAQVEMIRETPQSLRQAASELGFVHEHMSAGSSEPAFVAAQLAEHLGQRTEAVRQYRQTLADDPARRDAFEALQRLGEVREADQTLFSRTYP